MRKIKKMHLSLSILLLFLQGCSGNALTASDMQGTKSFYQVVNNHTPTELKDLSKNNLFIICKNLIMNLIQQIPLIFMI